MGIGDKFEEAKGKVKETLGDKTDNESLEAEGKADQFSGKTKDKLDNLADSTEDKLRD